MRKDRVQLMVTDWAELPLEDCELYFELPTRIDTRSHGRSITVVSVNKTTGERVCARVRLRMKQEHKASAL